MNRTELSSRINTDGVKGQHYVYTLAYPESMGGAVFYVGKGVGDRIEQHEREARRKKHSRGANLHKIRVIRKIWVEDKHIVKTKVAIFDTHEEAISYEIALIFLMDGLTNQTSGGEGTFNPSEEVRIKISEANKKRLESEEFRLHMVNVHMGKKHTEETRRKMSESHKEYTFSEEHRQRLSKSGSARMVGEFQKGTIVIIPCEICGEPTPDNTRHLTRRQYCSDACKQKAYRKRQRTKQSAHFAEQQEDKTA